MHHYNNRRRYSHHAFEAIQIERDGTEALLSTIRVTKYRDSEIAYDIAERLCVSARQLAHKPAAFVREINGPQD